mgnify:FL=1
MLMAMSKDLSITHLGWENTIPSFQENAQFKALTQSYVTVLYSHT